jgi:predicted  nucleic acid-binding Zn-ribbon protein
MENLDQRLAALHAEMNKLKGELSAAGSKAQAATTKKLADLRVKANAAKQQAGAAAHAGLTKFETELAALEAKVKGAVTGTPPKA